MNEKKYCVYMHKNKTNGKVYIGQTCDIKGRFARKGKYYKYCTAFNNAIQKYGWDGFEHIILKSDLSKEKADYWEKQYIKKYDAQGKGEYNIVSGGQANNECHQKAVTSYNLKTGEIKHFISRRCASTELFGDTKGINCITRCINGDKQQYKGHLFADGIQNIDVFAEKITLHKEQEIKRIEQIKKKENKSAKLRHTYPITAYNYKTETLLHFNTPDEAQKTLFPDKKYSCVTPCLNPNDKQISYRFYYFFKGTLTLKEAKLKATELYNKHYVQPKRNAKYILVYDVNTDMLYHFLSIKDAATKLFVSEQTVRKYSKNHRIYNDFLFAFRQEWKDIDEKTIKNSLKTNYKEMIEKYLQKKGLKKPRKPKQPRRSIIAYNIITGETYNFSTQTEAARSLFGNADASKGINAVLRPKRVNSTYKNYKFYYDMPNNIKPQRN